MLPSEPLCHRRPSGLTGSSGMLTLFGPGGEFSLDIQDVRVLRTSPRSLLSGRPRSCDPPPGLSQDPLLLPWLLRVPVNLGLDIRMPPMPAAVRAGSAGRQRACLARRGGQRDHRRRPRRAHPVETAPAISETNFSLLAWEARTAQQM